MDTSRFVIRDHQWAKMEPHCLGLKSHPGRTGSDARIFMEAVFWIARTGLPWRDPLPVSAFATQMSRQGATRLRKLEHDPSPVQGLGPRRCI